MSVAQGIVWIAIIYAALCYGSSSQTARRRGPIIKQVDRILIESTDPGSLFSFFADTLLIPVAWPLTKTEESISGAVGTGNVNIEFFRRTRAQSDSSRKVQAARYAGIAFEPYALASSIREMQVDGIPHGTPQPYVSTLPKGTQGVLWTTVTLPTVSRPGMSVFLYECSPEYLKTEIRRRQLGNRLVLNAGGPVGIQAVSEIVIESENLQKDTTLWQQLLGKPISPGRWQPGSGPAITLTRGTTSRIQSIAFKIESIKRAREFLRKSGLLGAIAPEEISLNPSKVQGLSIRLKE